MSRKIGRQWLALGLLTVIAAGLWWHNAQADRPGGWRLWLGATGDKATTQELGGAERYLTFVSTDKPIYRAGEKVYVRGVLLNAADRKPLNQQAQATIEIKGPKGDTVASGFAPTQDSAWGFAWEVPNEQAGGEYTIKATYPWQGHAPAERKFDIRAYRAPRLRSQIVFLRDGYGPGEKVTASLHTERAEGGIPEGAKVTVSARVDGMAVDGGTAKVDAKGNCAVSFDLPKEIARGEGALALIIEDGGVVETASKTIPILLQTIDIQFYPEGGELVAGLPNRVYFEARQPNGKPADVEGHIMPDVPPNARSAGGMEGFNTNHEGRGRVDLSPIMGRFAVITKPAGIKKRFELPAPKPSGVIIRTHRDTSRPGEPVNVTILSTDDRRLRVTLAQREVEVASVETEAKAYRSDVKQPFLALDPKDASGVLRVTVWDEKGTPLAERLIYREPARKLKVEVTSENKNPIPGAPVKLNVKTTDGDGKPVSAVVGLTVTDDSVLEMIEKREQAPRLPVMVLLEPEVKELADAQIYLDESNPKAALAVDLLLGTQGWRRFAFMDAAKFIAAHGDAARRVLALRMASEQEKRRGLKIEEVAEGRDGAVLLLGVPQAAAAPPPAAAPAVPPPAAEPLMDRPVRAPEADADKKMPAQAAGKLQKAMKEAEGLRRARQLIAADRDMEQAQNNLIVVREYAHQVRPDRKPNDRVDFAETLYWNAGVKTDANGAATVAFALNDSITTFRVFADAFGGDGALGAGAAAVESRQPFYAEAKLPLEVTGGDKVLLPVTVVNATGSPLSAISLAVQLFGAALPGEELRDVAPDARVRRLIPIQIREKMGGGDFVLKAGAAPFYSDSVTRKLVVKPRGFPIEKGFGGLLGANATAAHAVTIADAVVPNSVTTNIAVYPTPLGNLTEALQRLIVDPNGCFEQTSSTSYPLTMAQQYFLSHTGVDPKVVEAARQKLDAGYKRLVSFWCPDRGYEWFGQDPGHEALTAFGLLHFSDMAQVREVDRNMIGQTRGWLMKQRDGKGGFERKRRALHTWIEDRDCSNAYIAWALLEGGEKPADLAAEIGALKTSAAQSQNSYVLALAANAFFLAGEKDEAKKQMDRLAAKQVADGSVSGGTATIVGSGGEALTIETAALATLAWLRDPNYAGNVEKAMKFLCESCKNGRYSSTQATVLALRAIVTYDKLRARPKAAGRVRVFVDGQGVGEWLAFDPKTEGALKLPDVSELLTKGEHKIEVKMENGGEMPYSVAVSYNAFTPASSKECKLSLEVKLAQDEVAEGAATEANVTVANKTKEAVPTPVAIVGLPGGLEPRHDQLKELVKKHTIDAYEVLGREVVLYWRSLAAEQKVEVPLSLIAAIPGTYTGPASRAYLYYTDEHKQWVDGAKVTVKAKE
jgi:uncharacterized protein YfaS (alpha-2-macroglobulin family)